jgi:hypothetical protein
LLRCEADRKEAGLPSRYELGDTEMLQIFLSLAPGRLCRAAGQLRRNSEMSPAMESPES